MAEPSDPDSFVGSKGGHVSTPGMFFPLPCRVLYHVDDRVIITDNRTGRRQADLLVDDIVAMTGINREHGIFYRTFLVFVAPDGVTIDIARVNENAIKESDRRYSVVTMRCHAIAVTIDETGTMLPIPTLFREKA